jgi:hypothetical protein
MSNPGNQLREVVAPTKGINREGVIESVTGSTVVVRTSKGRKEMTLTGATTYRAGDRVRLSGDVVVGKLSSATVPTYYV